MPCKIFALIFLLCASSFNVHAEGGKVESIGAFTDQSASESVRNALEPKGYRVVLADGSVACEVWLRNNVPTQPRADVQGAVYTEIPESTLVGVLSFPKQATDFRGQGIKPGAYTLRYALHPPDGNHMGISPYRDFLLLTPVAIDQSVDAVYKFQDLVKLSAKTIGNNHPAPLSLVHPEGNALPGVAENEHGHVIFGAKLKTKSGAELPFAFIIKGVAEQ